MWYFLLSFYPELAVQYAVKVSPTNLRDALLEGGKDEPNSWKSTSPTVTDYSAEFFKASAFQL
jgi:hypothetical protein